MPSPAPEPLAPRPLSVWLVSPLDDIPGEGMPAARVRTLARVLAARGHDVTWWSSTWSHRRKAIRALPLGILDDEGFAVRLVAARPYPKDVSLARLASHRDFGRNFERLASEALAADQLERPDVIVAALPPLEGVEAAVRLARRLDATVVADVARAWPESFTALLPGPPLVRRLLAAFAVGGMADRKRRLLASVDGVIASSQACLDGLAPELPASLPRHVCPVGAYLQDFVAPRRPLPAGPGAAAAATDAAAPQLRCVYAGALEPGRDLQTLVAAARLLSTRGVAATIHVAGTGPWAERLRQSAEAVPGPCRMVLHGPLDRRGHVRLLADCDVGLVLAGTDAPARLPAKACDYAAAGLALVTGPGSELASLVEEFEAGLDYVPGDAASLARAVAALAEDRGRLSELRRGARRLAAARFDRERTVAALADWLETLPGGQPPEQASPP